MKTKQNQYHSQSTPQHPGLVLKEVLKDLELGTEEVSKILGEYETGLIQLLEGEREMTIQIAVKLENLVNVPATFWMNRQRRYNG